MPEKYQASEAEMQAAEAMMLPLQKELTEKRVRVIELLKAQGVNGLLIATHYGWKRNFGDDPVGDAFDGHLNGHTIYVNDTGMTYLGHIDWHSMNPQQAKAVWHRYHEVSEIITYDDLEAARQELKAQPVYTENNRKAAELLKDIL